ncbi:hypothetical protein Goe24_01180 [Bacillus phage vB_BsuM-Goe24]|nr:hypothetical protein BSP14_108 [Bacillus phage BSP14]AYJ76306.1 hypothetical protein BSP12_120 [Bacillus phage BSP12]QDP43143.1 hypothetical protein Goe7_c01180 [Bacillus phage vB_BveM-Goe7]UJJ74665.1 hypothetical protein [Bacillus phage BM-P1]WCS69235.1 hypothetical protein Goe20_01180 [Bacillus phage vB_BsuM-Goe20]WCS69493.1 hypothetical protein Goe24_01180 [Bacillus phage vB_BsuM-Goe24]WCS69746.1 hypothetical protein Goe25_01180 [Bacillus phage vB_BsuM-Goe25]
MSSLSEEIKDLELRIAGTIHHGECFYEESDLLSLLSDLKKLKELIKQHYKENQEDNLDD